MERIERCREDREVREDERFGLSGVVVLAGFYEVSCWGGRLFALLPLEKREVDICHMYLFSKL